MTDEVIHLDAFNLLCGKLLGEGIHRKVFECKLRPDLVCKVEYDTNYRDFANVKEAQFYWDNEHYKPVASWLAPVRFLSPDGRILLQDRADAVGSEYKLPEKVPSFLTDLKRENFGILKGRLVCLDYSMAINSPSARLKKAQW